MQFQKIALLSAAALASTVSADGYTPGDEWSTLTPTATYSCGATEYPSSFGIAIQTVGSSSSIAKRDAVSQIGDGQVQATSTSAPSTTATESATESATSATETAVSQINDGQLQQTTASDETGSTTVLSPSSTTVSNTVCPTESITLGATSCKNSGTLTIQLKDGVLTDGKGRIGAIVSNRQFQFDGPPPQAGSIYAAGWSITSEGNLALGDNDIFYQCLSGNFYNLYDQSIGEQCHPIHLELVNLVDC